MRFHLVHIIPNQMMHGLNGYREVIETVRWGLEQLGHAVTCSVNDVDATCQNIVFGAQVLRLDQLASLPRDTIVYNFEQLRGVDNLRPEMRFIVSHFQVWDYSTFNVDSLMALSPPYPPVVAPVGYAPILSRIAQKPEGEMDIDALIYGMPNVSRLSAFNLLANTGMTTVFLCGLYGQARDELIARSKVIVNLSLRQRSGIFEIVRVSYLLANRKAVVSHTSPTTSIEAGLRGAFAEADADHLVEAVRQLVADPASRAALEEKGHAAISERDIRPILSAALRQTASTASHTP